MPITAITMLFATIALLGSWGFIRQRIQSNRKGSTYQAHLMSLYFLYMGIFTAIMFAPHLLVNLRPDAFPTAMAIGYVVGHIFCYIAFLQILRLTFSFVPRFQRFQIVGLFCAGLFATALTVVNAQTMIWGKRPEFDYEIGVTLFNAHPLVGAGIGVIALVCVVPAAILLIINGFTDASTRIRSLLLGTGFLITMIAGPMHDIARSASIYVAADVISILGISIMTAGVAYRITQKISLTHRPYRASP